MPDDIVELLIARSRETRAQAELLIAWSEAVRATSLAIIEQFDRSKFGFERSVAPPARAAGLPPAT